MSTRGKIWNPGAATFQRVCFPGYGGRQPDRSHSMPADHSVRHVEAPDESGVYQATRRRKVDRVRTPEGDRYVLPSYALTNSEPEHSESSDPQEPLFFSSTPAPRQSVEHYQVNHRETEPDFVSEPTNYSVPTAYGVNTQHAEPSHSASVPQQSTDEVPLTQQGLQAMMQREIEALREQLTAALVKSVHTLVEGDRQASASHEPIVAETETVPPCETHPMERVQVAEIDSESVSSYEKKALIAKKALSFYAKSPVPSGAVTSYQLPGSGHQTLKTLESKLCTSLPFMEITPDESESHQPVSAKEQGRVTADSVYSRAEQNIQPEAMDWKQQSEALIPVIQKTCRDMIQAEVQVLREQLTGIIKESLNALVVNHDVKRPEPEKPDETLNIINQSLKKKVKQVNAAAIDLYSLKAPASEESAITTRDSANVSHLGCFSEAGAVAYRKLRKSPEKVVSFQRKGNAVTKSDKETSGSRRKVTEAQQKIKGLRDQLNAIVQNGSQFFTTGNEKEKIAENRAQRIPKESNQQPVAADERSNKQRLDRNHHSAITKYRNLSKQNEGESDKNQSGDLKRVWRWGGSSPRVASGAFSKAKPTF